MQLDRSLDFANSGIEAIPGRLNVSVHASFLDTYAEAAFPGTDFVDCTGTSELLVRLLDVHDTLRYSNGPMSVGLGWQHLPSFDPAPDSAANALGVDSHDQFDRRFFLGLSVSL